MVSKSKESRRKKAKEHLPALKEGAQIKDKTIKVMKEGEAG